MQNSASLLRLLDRASEWLGLLGPAGELRAANAGLRALVESR